MTRVPFLLGHVEDHPVTHDPGVVDHDVDPSEVVERRLDDPLATRHGGHRLGARRGPAAGALDLAHHVLGG